MLSLQDCLDMAVGPEADRATDLARLQGIAEAKCHDDCCACTRLSLVRVGSLSPETRRREQGTRPTLREASNPRVRLGLR